jgi:hypothetical protein
MKMQAPGLRPQASGLGQSRGLRSEALAFLILPALPSPEAWGLGPEACGDDVWRHP